MQDKEQYFEHHKSVAEFYFTSDGLAFFTKEEARSHGKNLDDPEIEVMTRSEVEAITAPVLNDELYDPLDELDAE